MASLRAFLRHKRRTYIIIDPDRKKDSVPERDRP